MAKKRKAGGRHSEPKTVTEIDIGDSRKRIRTFEDVANSEDEFLLNRDQVRLAEEPAVKRRRKWAEQEEFLQASDEEVLGYSEQEDGEDDRPSERRDGKRREVDGSEEEDTQEEEEDELKWGTSKADLYGADAIETEEQALEEEAEALRLQKKHLESMNTADYGFDDNDFDSNDPAKSWGDGNQGDVVTEVLPEITIPTDMGSAERLKLLKSRYPEFEPLCKELIQLRETHSVLVQNAEKSTVALTKLRAASAYIGALVMYFCLLSSTASDGGDSNIATSASHLRDHPIMDNLVKCRGLWVGVAKLSEDDFAKQPRQTFTDEQREPPIHGGIREPNGESNGLQNDVTVSIPTKTRAERFADAAQSAKDQRRAERLRRTEANLADLDALLLPNTNQRFTKSRRIPAQNVNGYNSDLGEEVPLTEREAADKANRKRGLRFYTSQIAQKANKRGAAGRNTGGDDDIPYRERLKDRQARLNAEAEKRGKRAADAAATLGGESDEEDHHQAREIRADVEQDDYYDLIAARTTKEKHDKAALAEAQKQAALQGGRVVQEEIVGADGKRKISYAIAKNKGLTPHRKKDVRNPRVKKRKKYDEKKKKLASMKPVYRGGEGRGGYGGELTGIKKGLVKSTKL